MSVLKLKTIPVPQRCRFAYHAIAGASLRELRQFGNNGTLARKIRDP